MSRKINTTTTRLDLRMSRAWHHKARQAARHLGYTSVTSLIASRIVQERAEGLLDTPTQDIQPGAVFSTGDRVFFRSGALQSFTVNLPPVINKAQFVQELKSAGYESIRHYIQALIDRAYMLTTSLAAEEAP